MRIYHNSQDKEYRKPFGAVKCQEKVTLSLCVEGCCPESVQVRLWQGEEILVPMTGKTQNSGGIIFSADITMPEVPGLVWYYFIIDTDGRRYYYGRNRDGRGGEGELFDFDADSSYQITVYDRDFKTPDWFKKSVMYQIFPDRFFRDGEKCEIQGKTGEYTIHEDWYEPISFDKHPFEDGPACNDFFGGNLKGIARKLPYLKELGVSVLYLNPIFEAFSNHRYDTGDYSRIDPILGTEEDFENLCQKCEELGIRVILDGVFSHTGSDSVYFNKYGNYGENTGAYRDCESAYRGWYQWNDGDKNYNSWWGCSNLPNVNETETTYVDYILRSDDAIIKKWLRSGGYGWRLDVADELPDEFIKTLRSQVKSENPDAVIIGEVWEDASNKESYGVRREYLLGDELDSVMNYPFKDNVLAFLKEEIDSETFSKNIMTIIENYPFEALYSAMNILGTHDTMRVKTVLGGQYINDNMSREEKQNFRLDAHHETVAIKRLMLAAFLQMTFVGVPCIYYGDEIGMQGLADPFNRMPYTWRCVDVELLDYYKKLVSLRNNLDCLKTGEFKMIYSHGGVLVFERIIKGGKDVFGKPAEDGTVLCVVNRNPYTEKVEIELQGIDRAKGQLCGGEIVFKDGRAELTVPAFGAEAYIQW